MKYYNYAKIYFEDEEWCAKLDENNKKYISEYLYLNKENKIETFEDESYSIEELNKSKRKYSKITEKDYKEFIKTKTKQQFKATLELLYDKINFVNKEIEKVKNEEEYILNNY